MNQVTSKDGTTIAFDRLGDGPPVILVSGGPSIGSRTPASRRSSRPTSRSSTTTAVVAAQAATPCRMRSNGRSRTSTRSPARPVDPRISTEAPRARPLP